jgi:hypothetical protein
MYTIPHSRLPPQAFRNRRNKFEQTLVSIPCVAASSFCLFFALYLTLANFASVEFPEYGFDFGGIGPIELGLLFVLTVMASWAVPKTINHPSSLFLIFVFSFILVPFQVMGLASARAVEGNYMTLLIVVHLCFVGSCKIVSHFDLGESYRQVDRQPSKWLVPFLLVVWFAFTAALFALYGDIMSITSLDAIYGQRELGKAKNFLEGYLQSYYQFVIAPTLVAFGCYRKNILLLMLGIAGAVLSYSITAEKAGFIYPLFIVGLFFMIKARNLLFRATSVIAFGLSAIVFASLQLWQISSAASFLIWYLGTRTLLIPGTTITVYQEYFSRWD